MEASSTTLVTGFPGFIAGRLVAKLARPGVRQILLVEERFAEKARRDADAVADGAGVPRTDFEIVTGDITSPGLGTDAASLDRIREEVTDVFHLAAVYDLAVAKELAFKVNVEGTRNVNDLVRGLRNLERYNYVSTCYVAGRREGRILESELRHGAGFRNHYEETKFLAEVSVDELKSEVPLTVMRPSVVVGDAMTGETSKYDGIYYLIKYLLTAPSLLRLVNVGNRDVSLNLVPVDFVVDGIVSLSRNPKAVGGTFAVADPAPLSTSELFDLIAEAMTGRRSLVTPPAKLVEIFLKSAVSPPLTGLPHAGVPYFFLPQTYDTSAAQNLLSEEGVRCPGFGEYVGRLVSFVERHPYAG